VIALMVCINIVGKHVGRAVRSADAKLTGGYLLADAPAASGTRNSNERSTVKPESSDEQDAANVQPAHQHPEYNSATHSAEKNILTRTKP
jgi:hypothetical protein